MPAIALTHLALHVRKLADSVAFYERHCGMRCIHRRAAPGDRHGGVAWLAEPGREHDFVLVFIAGGPGRSRAAGDFGHLGFALSDPGSLFESMLEGMRRALTAPPGRTA